MSEGDTNLRAGRGQRRSCRKTDARCRKTLYGQLADKPTRRQTNSPTIKWRRLLCTVRTKKNQLAEIEIVTRRVTKARVTKARELRRPRRRSPRSRLGGLGRSI